MSKRCEHCKYWKARIDMVYNGLCTRYPKWVDVRTSHYCGEFKECDNE